MSPELYDHIRRIAWHIVRKRFYWMDEARQEDLSQAGIIRAWEAGATHPTRIYQAAQAGVIDEFRRSYGRNQRKRAFHLAQVNLDDVERREGYDDDTSSPKELLSQLPHRERLIAVRRAQGYTNDEIARELRVSESRISQLCARARRHIEHSHYLEAA